MIPRLVTERLVLRGWLARDRDAFAALNADPQVMRWIGDGSVLARADSDALAARIEAHWAEHGFGLWAVARREDEDELLGFCGLAIPSFLPEVLPAVEVGWRFAHAAWGAGFATEAAAAAVAWGFGELGLEGVLAIVDPANARSLRVAEKLRMSPAPSRVHPRTGRRVVVLARLREDFAA